MCWDAAADKENRELVEHDECSSETGQHKLPVTGIDFTHEQTWYT